jgi:hypothetical protein
VDALFKVSGQLTSLNFNLAGKQITEVYLVRDPLPPAGMFPTDSNGGMFSMGFQNESRTVDETRLEFAFSEVRPGSYHMYVETGNRVNRQDCCDVVGVADLRVGGEDVNGLRVRASVVDVSGRVEVLGNPSAKPSTSFNLAIVPDDIQTRLVKSDVAGAFTIPAVMNGKWKLQTSGLAKGYAVFDVMQGDASVYESGFQIEDKPPQSLRVLLSPAGTIDGVVRDAQQKPVPAANVLLIPSAPNPMASALYRSASSDAAGRFSFAAVPEGDFSVFAFDGSGLNEEIPKTSAAIQEFIVRDASRGTKARVTAGTVISVDLERLSRTP